MTITLTITFYSRIHSIFILVNFYQKHKLNLVLPIPGHLLGCTIDIQFRIFVAHCLEFRYSCNPFTVELNARRWFCQALKSISHFFAVTQMLRLNLVNGHMPSRRGPYSNGNLAAAIYKTTITETSVN